MNENTTTLPDPAHNCCTIVGTQPRMRRLVWWLFPTTPCLTPKPPVASGWPCGDVITTNVEIHIDWKDRIRLLFSGRAGVTVMVGTEHPVGWTTSTSAFMALPPKWMSKP